MSSLSIVIDRIQALTIPDEDDPDPPPTPALIARAIDLCQNVEALMTQPFPRAAVSGDEAGGISFWWWKKHVCAVSISLHSDGRNHLYHRDSKTSVSAIEKPLTPELLAQWLDWYAVVAAGSAEEHTQ